MRSFRPLEVTVADLLRQPGSRRDFQRTVALPGLGISTATVPDDARIELDLTLESLSSQIAVTGRVSARWVGECRRCLTPVTGNATSVVREIVEPDPTEGETYLLGADMVDLEPLVRDAVLLALPLAPLCRPDCDGPAPEVFPTGPGAGDVRDEDPLSSTEEPASSSRDPRWAALDDVRFDES